MKKFTLIICLLLAALCSSPGNAWAEEVGDTVKISLNDIHDGSRIYIETAVNSYRGLFMTAYPAIPNKNSVMINDVLSDVGTNALWQLIATGQNDAIYTDKPTYYLKDVTSGKYFGAASSLASVNSDDKRMVEGTDMAYSFCLLTASEIASKQGVNVNKYGVSNAVYFHHSNADGTWFRLSRFGGYTQLYYISSSQHNTAPDWQAWALYTPDVPNNYKAKEGIAQLQAYYDEVAPYYSLMTHPTYDDAALTAEHLSALNAALQTALTALTDFPSPDNSYYTDIKASLQSIYEEVPFVSGGSEMWAITADSIQDGKQVLFECGPTDYLNRYIKAYPDVAGQNSVMANDEGKEAATIWKLVATGNNDPIYTSKPTYFLQDIASSKYYGTSADLTSIDPAKKSMVATTDKAYAFCILTAADIKTQEGKNMNTYTNPNAVFIHHSNSDGTWFRLSRYGAYTHLYYVSDTNAAWQAWNAYTADKNLSIAQELSQAIAEYGTLGLDNVGSSPGEYDAAIAGPYNAALAQANEVNENSSRQYIRETIDNLKATYQPASQLQRNPIVDGYYYIQSAWSQKSEETCVVYDPNDGSNKLRVHELDTNSKYDIFYISKIADGQYRVQNMGSSLYVGKQEYNYIPLEAEEPSIYHAFSYDDLLQYKWTDSSAGYTYYIHSTNMLGRYNKRATSDFDAWYIKPVAQSTIDDLNSYAIVNNNGALKVSGAVDNLDKLTTFMQSQERVTSIDMEDATLASEITAQDLTNTVSGNTLIYLPTSSSLTGTNLINNGQCANLQLADKSDFAPLGAFVAATGTISRKLYAGLNTACLPFSLSASQIPVEGAKLYVYSSQTQTTISFNEVTSVDAGVPCIIELPQGSVTQEYTISITNNANIVASPQENNAIVGSFVNKLLGAGFYKLNTDDTFVSTLETSTIKAFRFYLTVGSGASPSYTISLNSDDLTGIDSTDAANTDAATQANYNLLGQKSNGKAKGIVIKRLNNGKTIKVMQ